VTRWIIAAALLTACGNSGDDGGGGDIPGEGVLFVNEVMPSNLLSACKDIAGENDDWVELYNSGGSAIDLGGFTISDDPIAPTKFTFPVGLTVPAHGYLMLWADDQVQGLDHLPFKLNADGESIAIYAPSGDKLDSFEWTIATTDQVFARFPDGTGAFTSCAANTCGVSNGSGCP
jgi:hypothetical protein